jgi:hypothetical protein
VTIDDVWHEGHGSRTRHFLTQHYGTERYAKLLTMDAIRDAEKQAAVEMLDEIHCMLRHLCGNKQEWRD